MIPSYILNRARTGGKVTSSEIVSELYRYQSHQPITLHEKLAFLNYYVTADFLSVTKAGQVTEFEVKVSRSDYLRERKKRRHGIYWGKHCGDGFAEIAPRSRWNLGKEPRKVNVSHCDVPNRFWIVAPEGVVKDKEDLLPYAGLLIFDPDSPPGSRLTIRHRAPTLRKESFAWKDLAPFAAAMKLRLSLPRQFKQ